MTMSRNASKSQFKTFRTTISDEHLIKEIDEFQSENDLSNGEFLKMAVINFLYELD